MKIHALIVDDEPLAHKVILEYAKSLEHLEIVGQCYLATEALAKLHETEVDLLFLDIQMPKLKGLDFLRLLKNPPLVILTTAYQEFALEGYELDVVDYLLKPFRLERFIQAIEKAKWRMQNGERSRSDPAHSESSTTSLFIKTDKRLVQIETDSIYYLESYGNYVKVWLSDQFHLTARTLSSFDAELGSSFFRIHKSYLIQRRWIDYVEGGQVRLKNGTMLPIGKAHRNAFRDWL
ncbi:MAG: LytTR family DNA-binding domain-containing protein [Bacteroidota bacterium]